MAPKKQKAPASQSKTDGSRSESTSIELSQELETRKIDEVMGKANKRLKDRRHERKQKIISAHESCMQKLNADIKQCLEKHDKKLRAIRRPHAERLIELLRKKRGLEQRVDKSQSDLEQAFLSTARQLQVALDGRVDELSA